MSSPRFNHFSHMAADPRVPTSPREGVQQLLTMSTWCYKERTDPTKTIGSSLSNWRIEKCVQSSDRSPRSVSRESAWFEMALSQIVLTLFTLEISKLDPLTTSSSHNEWGPHQAHVPMTSKSVCRLWGMRSTCSRSQSQLLVPQNKQFHTFSTVRW